MQPFSATINNGNIVSFVDPLLRLRHEVTHNGVCLATINEFAALPYRACPISLRPFH